MRLPDYPRRCEKGLQCSALFYCEVGHYMRGLLCCQKPLTATILAWMFFNERLSIVGIAGAVMLLTAIYLLLMKEKQLEMEAIPV